MSQEFQTFLQKYQYQLNSEQRKSIRRYTRQAYAASVRRAHERTQTELTSEFTSQQPAFPKPNVATKQIKTEEQSDHPPGNPDLDEGVAVAKPHGFKQAGKFETIAPVRVTDEGRRASTGGIGPLSEVVPAAPADMGASKLTKPPLAAHQKRVRNASTMRGCIPCRSVKRKCVFTGTGCTACSDAGIQCSFRPGDKTHNLQVINDEAVVNKVTIAERKAPESRTSGRCLLCRQRHLKCVPQGASCVVCIKAGAGCSNQELGLVSDSKLLAGLQDASIVGPGSLDGHVKQEEARSPIEDCYQHVSKSFCGSDDSIVHGNGTPVFTHPDDRSALSVNREYSPAVSRSQATSYPNRLLTHPSRRRPSLCQPGNPPRTVQSSPKRLRGHAHVADIGNQVDQDCSAGNSISHTRNNTFRL